MIDKNDPLAARLGRLEVLTDTLTTLIGYGTHLREQQKTNVPVLTYADVPPDPVQEPHLLTDPEAIYARATYRCLTLIDQELDEMNEYYTRRKKERPKVVSEVSELG